MLSYKNSITTILRGKFFRDTYALQAAAIVQIISGIASSVVIARSLGAAHYGEYALIYTLYRTINSFVIIGIGPGTRALFSDAFAFQRYEEARNVLAFYFKLIFPVQFVKLFLGIALSVSFAEKFYGNSEIGHIAKWLFLDGIFLSFYLLTGIIFQATRMVKQLAYFEASSNIVRAGLLIVVAFSGGELFHLILTHLIATIISSLAAYFLYLHYSRKHHPAFPSLIEVLYNVRSVSIKKYMAIGFKIQLSKTIVEWIALVPLNLLGMYTKPELVGFFKLASTTVKIPQFLLNAISRNILAKLYEVRAQNSTVEMFRIYKKISFTGGALTVVQYGAYFFILPILITILYGQDYGKVAPIAQILVLPLIFSGFVLGVHQVLIILEKQGVYILSSVIPFFVCLPAAFSLVNSMHAIGAALFSIAVQAITIIWQYLYINSYLKTKTRCLFKEA